MSITDAILATFAATVTLIVIAVAVHRAIRGAKRYAREILQAVRDNTVAVGKAGGIVAQVVQELAYMRNLTQQVSAANGQVLPETQPPVGHPGTMPPAFPSRPYDTYAYVPDAKVEDTDQSLLKQTDAELMEAQAREEMRASGVEPMDDTPQAAVGEEA